MSCSFIDVCNLTQCNWIGGNHLGGTIATELGQLTNLQYLAFYSNVITGTIPTEIGKLTALTAILLCKLWQRCVRRRNLTKMRLVPPLLVKSSVIYCPPLNFQLTSVVVVNKQLLMASLVLLTRRLACCPSCSIWL